MKILLPNDWSTISLKINQFFRNGGRSLPRNPPSCIFLDNWIFDNFILADQLFPKSLRRFATWLSVSNSLYGKVVSLSESKFYPKKLELPIKVNDDLKVTPASFCCWWF